MLAPQNGCENPPPRVISKCLITERGRGRPSSLLKYSNMKYIGFPPAYDNEAAHRQVKLLMMQGKELHIRVEDEEVWISCQGVTGLRYLLNDDGWQWILGYLQTGEYEDFGVFPSAVSHIVNDGYKENKVKGLVEQGCNILPVSFHRETEAYISLRAFFKFGKLFFRIRRTDDFINYLIEQKLW